MSAVLAKPQVKEFLKTLAKGKEKGQEQRKEHNVNAHAVTEEGEPSKKPWEKDIPKLSSPSYSPSTSFSYSSDSSSSSNPRRRTKGDLHIDDHHTNEDIALAFGTALLQALGDRKGISRFGDFTAPLDEALVHVVLDLSGRPFLAYDMEIPTERVGTYDTQLVEHFFQSIVNTSGMTLHIRKISGKNSHHIIEACFKAFARALRKATEYDERRMGTIPSSKGVLSRA
ncbi:hypothetical protein L7F22_043140 [Adiantum nelumboides]|nr:hypothetical protein [Adiantum nelumboides]